MTVFDGLIPGGGGARGTFGKAKKAYGGRSGSPKRGVKNPKMEEDEEEVEVLPAFPGFDRL